MKKAKVKQRKAVVFCVPSDESSSGYHEVIYAKDGDLNRAARQGKIKNFRDWGKAVGFSHEKGKELGAEVIIHSHGKTPSKTYRYQKPTLRKGTRKLSRGFLRISPKMPRLR